MARNGFSSKKLINRFLPQDVFHLIYLPLVV